MKMLALSRAFYELLSSFIHPSIVDVCHPRSVTVIFFLHHYHILSHIYIIIYYHHFPALTAWHLHGHGQVLCEAPL